MFDIARTWGDDPVPQNAIPKVVTSVTGQRDRHPLTISDLQIPMGIPVMAVMGSPINPGLTGWHPRWTNGGWVQLKKMLHSQSCNVFDGVGVILKFLFLLCLCNTMCGLAAGIARPT